MAILDDFKLQAFFCRGMEEGPVFCRGWLGVGVVDLLANHPALVVCPGASRPQNESPGLSELQISGIRM